MKSLAISPPNDKQKLFLTDTHKHIAFGGARGGGKSWSVRTKAKLLCLRYAGIKTLIVRKSYKELVNNHISFLVSELKDIAKYNKTDKTFIFANGSTITFGYCATDSDLDQYQGAEYDVIFLDEATQLDEMWIKKITACVRGVNTFPKRIYYTCNPGGRSHGYIKRLFIDKKYNTDENPDDYSFIQSLVTDNWALMQSQPDYIKTLEALPLKLKEAWLYGNWNIFEGQFFEDFADNPAHYDDREFTHVINPFKIPDSWSIYRSYDFGYARPFSCGWWAVDHDGRIYRILELYGCTAEPNTGVKWSPEQQFAEIAKLEHEHEYLKGKRINGVADPSIWDASRGESIAETASKYKVYFDKGDNERLAGWMQCHYRLQFDESGIPMVYIFKNCEAFIRTIPILNYSEIHPEDLDTTQEDHVADDFRYFCMSRPITPKVKKENNVIVNDPLNLSPARLRTRRL